VINAIIVDDESIVRKGLKLSLPWAEAGIRIAGEAASGDKALELLKEQEAELVLTDISMPGMNGLELLKRLNDQYPQISTVILTCHQDFEYIQEALRYGAIDYIVKTQLEDENIQQVLTRIFDRVTEKNKQQEAPKHSEFIENYDKFKELWTSVLWLTDNEHLARMSNAQAIPSHLKERETLLAASVSAWKDKLTIQWPQAWLNSIREVFIQDPRLVKDQLRSGRTDIMRLLRRSGYSEEIIHSILRAVEYIHLHSGRRINQDELCCNVNMSKGYFSKCFRDILGMSFIEYLQLFSVNLAKKLLASSNHPIYWIAEQSGFQDEKYFSRVFKQKTGMLPSEYRQILRGV